MNRRAFVKAGALASVVGLPAFLAACQSKAPVLAVRPGPTVNYAPTVAVAPSANGRIIFAPLACDVVIYHQGTFRGSLVSSAVYYAFDVADGTKVYQPVDNYTQIELRYATLGSLKGSLVLSFTIPEGILYVYLPSATSDIDLGANRRRITTEPFKASQSLATVTGQSKIAGTEGYNVVMAATDTTGKWVDLSYFSWDVKGPACRRV
jgi:hypothetical protein